MARLNDVSANEKNTAEGFTISYDNYPQKIGYIDALKRGFQQYCSIDGRASRAEFWWFWLTFLLLLFIPFLNLVVLFGMGIPLVAVSCRRLHDIGCGAGWFFIQFVPLIGSFWLLIMYALKGEPYPNRFGSNPYGLNISDNK